MTVSFLSRFSSKFVVAAAVSASLAVSAVFCVPDVAVAREASASWVDGFDPATLQPGQPAPLQSRDEARQAAFGKAVFLEALDLLPVAIPEARQVLLREYLRPLTGSFVQTYSEMSETRPTGDSPAHTLTLDVSVNRRALKKALQGIGIYYTAETAREYQLSLGGVTEEAWEQLGRLQALTGVRVENAAEPRLHVEFAEGIWKGRIEFGDTVEAAAGEDLTAVWASLWTAYFSGPEFSQSSTASALLRVEGWYTPDGVKAFDRTLRGWDGALDDAVLSSMDITTDGITALWQLKVTDAVRLERSLDGYLPGRGLRWKFESQME